MTRTSPFTTGRSRRSTVGVALVTLTIAIGVMLSTPSSAVSARPGALTFSNPSGALGVLGASGADDNPFFQDLGTNGRACVTCHQPAQGWSVTPAELRDRFDRTGGLDPVFRTNDASNCEGAEVSTLNERRRAYSLLLTRGVFRVGLDLPDDTEFDVVDADDPYHCGAAHASVSMYRRPLPSVNLRFVSAVMWDGRESAPGEAIRASLLRQALDATTGHAQGAPPSPAQLRQIVDFELGLYAAQVQSRAAGRLDTRTAGGGPVRLASEPFCIGINDPLAMLPSMPGACPSPSDSFDPVVFRLFAGWTDSASPHRQAVARGEAIFNSRPFVIDGVSGLNGRPDDPVRGALQNGTCTVCHDTPGAGNHSVPMALDIGVTDASRRAPDLPLYTLRRRATGETVQTTDPGRAMITGRWNDVGKFKGPVLRGLASRAPFFHDGSAASLADVIDFYDTRFQAGFTTEEKVDLLAFLRSL